MEMIVTYVTCVTGLQLLVQQLPGADCRALLLEEAARPSSPGKGQGQGQKIF